ncbi:ATP/GTP-binding protein [Prescottella equi]|uniref:ATP/GTP-binding protein n=1 Tax=Rhodococcus hoagii TaxID=43767 RepID=UPI001ADDCF15|nr:ATP/GTP-binding protein [Prescottella equi]MBM4670187.1 ATP/GTP-binding protein [Prescottella equi]
MADLVGSYEPGRAKHTGSLRDPMAAARKRRRAEERQRIEDEKAERRAARKERDPSRREPKWRHAPRLTDRGFEGRGGGLMGVVDVPPEFRGTTVQACGLDPFSVGNTYPIAGTPLGKGADGTAFHYDPISATYRARRQNTPSVFVLGLPSFGKSTLARKFVSGAIAQGQIPFVFADTKPDFAKEIEIIGGDRAKIVRLGHGEGYLNPLGIGALGSIIPLLENFPQVQIKVIKQVHQRRKRIMQSLCEIERGTPLTQTERNVLTAALRLLEHDDRFGYETPPLISDLIALIDNPPQELMRKVYTQNADRYREKVEPLLETLAALLDGDLGEVFSQQTTTPIDFTGEDPPVAVCVDISALSHGDTKLEAAVMAACWEDGFGAIEAAHVLADCGLREQLHFLATLDEFWRVLSGGPGMVSRIDALTRLTRTLGTALVMITHTVKDLESLEADFDIMKAKGFIERAGAVIVGALPRGEMEKLDNIIPFTRDDKAWVSSLSTPGAYDPILGKPAPPPGRGHFLLKQGTERIPGHRFETVMTPTEIKYGWHDTDARFYGATAQGLAEREAAA